MLYLFTFRCPMSEPLVDIRKFDCLSPNWGRKFRRDKPDTARGLRLALRTVYRQQVAIWVLQFHLSRDVPLTDKSWCQQNSFGVDTMAAGYLGERCS